MLVSETVEVRWHGNNRKHFEGKGYIFTKINDWFTVKVTELSNNTRTKIKLKCDTCYIEKEISLHSYLKSQGYNENGLGYYMCHSCWWGNTSKSHDDFVNEVKALTGESYTFLSNYERSYKKIKVIHNKCGYIFDIVPTSLLLNPNVCSFCSKTVRKSDEDFKKEIYELVGDEYKVLGVYESSNKKIEILHEICGTKYFTTNNSFIRNGTRCRVCFGTPPQDTQTFKQRVFDLEGNKYTVVGEYSRCDKKIAIIHNECGHEYNVLPNSFIQGQRCPRCFKNHKKTTIIFKQEVSDLVGLEYEVLGEYDGLKKKILMKHNICGLEWTVSPSNFLRLCSRCPKCKESKGERKIINFLNGQKLNVIEQYRFKDCRNIKPLPFDFAILDTNGKVILLIEYQGQQHYQLVNYWGGEKGFEKRKKYDLIKKNYCNSNNLRILYISYDNFDQIEEILTNELIKLNIDIAI